MFFITLPTSPLPQSANPMPLDYGSWQEGALGGASFRLDRPGSRFAMTVTMPRMKPEPTGRIWVARLIASVGSIVRMPFPQVGLSISNPGTPLVNGAGIAGTSRPIDGLTAGYTVREGQFFNLYDAAGRAYLYITQGGDVAADNSGAATLTIWPMRLMTPADNSAVNLAAPFIEGKLSGAESGWTLERAGTRGLQFTITEVR